MTPETTAHLELAASILIPVGSGIAYLIWTQAQNQLKIDAMWLWFSNHGSELTGYKAGDERKKGLDGG